MKVDYFAELSVPTAPDVQLTTGDAKKPSVASFPPLSPVSPVVKIGSGEVPQSPSSVAQRVDDFPTWCHAGCPALEYISGVGLGCVQVLADGPWHEEWRRLGTMATCPKRVH